MLSHLIQFGGGAVFAFNKESNNCLIIVFNASSSLTALAGKFFRRVEFGEISKLALCSVNSATCQIAHFRQTARFLEKFNCQGSIFEIAL